LKAPSGWICFAFSSQFTADQRLYRVGDAETPSILIAREDDGSQVEQGIASLLQLPWEQTHAPC
jgi:hypothetical protein